MHTENVKKSRFVLYEEFIISLRNEKKQEFNNHLMEVLITKSLVVLLKYNDELYLYEDDCSLCRFLMSLNREQIGYCTPEIAYDGYFFVERLQIQQNTFLYFKMEDVRKAVPAFVRNIMYLFHDEEVVTDFEEKWEYDLLGVVIITFSKQVAAYIDNAIYRKYRLDQIKLSNFANSSAYMGSKKSIVGFVVESLLPHIKDDSVVLDIMCGSGAASNAFSQFTDVIASDAQMFCRLLAKIQGAGFDVRKAESLSELIYPFYKENMYTLMEEKKDQLACEKELFHMDASNPKAVFEAYITYASYVPLYSSTESTSAEVLQKINLRKENHTLFPYCLYTYYFANIFFGLEQSMQIDSIRYAIDQIDDKDEKEWLLGVLVVTVSVIASNHAGHFAQPKRVDEKNITEIIKKRKQSAWLEFSRRLIAVAAESERYSFKVRTVDGPWEHALKQLAGMSIENLVVYLDAPYKRDEYSRYYHVLETAALYDYPESERKGRLRSKENGERFKTEFFSKNSKVVENCLKNTIVSILKMSKVCVWSYSDNGVASIPNVVDMVMEEVPCKIYLYSIPHKHTSQRKRRKNQSTTILSVMEYCIVFSRIEKGK